MSRTQPRLILVTSFLFSIVAVSYHKMFLGCFYIHHVTSILPELLNATSVNVKIECGKIISINPLLFASITFSVYAQRVKSPHTQQELFLEEMVHEGFAGNVLSDIKINKSAVFSSWKTPLGLFILLISDTRGTMAVIQAYLQSLLTKPRAFGPEAEPKAIYYWLENMLLMLLYLCIITTRTMQQVLVYAAVSNTHRGSTVALEFPRAVMVKLSLLHRVQRNTGMCDTVWVYHVFIRVSSVII